MTQIREILSKRPSIHLFYKAAFLQEPIFLSNGIAAIPYMPFNPDLERYFLEYLASMQIKCDASQLNASIEASRQRNAGLIIVIPIDSMIGDPDKDEKINLAIDRTEDVFSWATEDRLDLVGAIVLNPDPGDTKYYFEGSNSRQRLRLGPGNAGSSFVDNIESLRQCQLTDEHFSFLLTIARDALYEPRITFRIAKYFSCLEGLASALKNKDTYEKLSAKLGKTPELTADGRVGSRSAVKLLISWQNHISQHNIHGTDYKLDAVLIGGLMRDMLFHGVPFTPSPNKPIEVESCNLLEISPQSVEQALRGLCEVELVRWAKGISHAQIQI